MNAPEEAPHCTFAFEARVTIDPLIVVGASKLGQRQLFPITGGSVSGPSLTARVVPGGADWQLVRPDGVVELDARYLLETEDGVRIQVRNRGLLNAVDGGVYFRTTPEFEAPNDSPYGYLNRFLFLCSVTMDEPGVVRIRFFKVE